MEEPTNHSHKSILLLIGAAILLLLGLGFVLTRPAERGPDQYQEPELEPVTLVDGEEYPMYGVFHDSPTANGLKAYRSEEFGISFSYPGDHVLFENTVSARDDEAGLEGAIIFLPEEDAHWFIARALAEIGGGGPPLVSFNFFRNSDSLPLEEWLLEHRSYSNFHPEVPYDPSLNATLSPIAVGGVSGFTYYSPLGMWESDYVAFEHGELVVIVWIPVNVRASFETVLPTIELHSEI